MALLQKTAEVAFDEAAVSPDALVSTVEDAGFEGGLVTVRPAKVAKSEVCGELWTDHCVMLCYYGTMPRRAELQSACFRNTCVRCGKGSAIYTASHNACHLTASFSLTAAI